MFHRTRQTAFIWQNRKVCAQDVGCQFRSWLCSRAEALRGLERDWSCAFCKLGHFLNCWSADITGWKWPRFSRLMLLRQVYGFAHKQCWGPSSNQNPEKIVWNHPNHIQSSEFLRGNLKEHFHESFLSDTAVSAEVRDMDAWLWQHAVWIRKPWAVTKEEQ